MAISGHKASVKVTSATVTTSTNEAATLSTDGVTLQIGAAAKRHWDIDSTSHPKVYDHSASTATAVGSSAYSINYVQGKVTFSTAHSTAATYMLDVQYVTASSWANARQWSMNIDQPILDATVFGSTWRVGQTGLRSGGASLGGFWMIGGGSTNPLAYDYIDTAQRIIVELYPQSTVGDRYEAYGWVAQSQTQAQVDALVGETVDLTLDGPVYWTTST